MYQQYINGKLVDGLGKPLDVLDPSTGEVVGTVGSANAAQAQQALDNAEALLEKMQQEYPDAEYIVQRGGQPLYYYYLSVE